MKVLITGANGFSAFHLIKLLSQDAGITIYRTDLNDCDLAQYLDIEKLLNTIKPDQIYHLAGSFTNDYQKDYTSNVLSTKNIFDALLKLNLSCKVLLIGSAAEYGVPVTNPISEDSLLKPVSVYGLTKVFQTHLMQYYATAHGLDLVMARTFNLMGRGISNRLFVGKLYEQIDQFKKGEISQIVLGDLSAERDYIDVEEAVLYYRAIMNHGNGIYNVGSGRPVKIADLLSRILKENGLASEVVQEKSTNKSCVAQIYADVTKLMNIL